MLNLSMHGGNNLNRFAFKTFKGPLQTPHQVKYFYLVKSSINEQNSSNSNDLVHLVSTWTDIRKIQF